MTAPHVQTVRRIVGDGSPTFRFDDPQADAAEADRWAPPVAIIVTVGDDRLAARRVIEHIRARDDVSAYAPVLVLDAQTTRPDEWLAHGTDQLLTSPPDPALLDTWAIEPNMALPRLVQHFGPSAIMPLLARFRGSLLALQASFGDGEAHTLAGIAGTLGFHALGTACEALQDDPAMSDTVLREVRKAIYDASQHLATYAAA